MKEENDPYVTVFVDDVPKTCTVEAFDVRKSSDSSASSKSINGEDSNLVSDKKDVSKKQINTKMLEIAITVDSNKCIIHHLKGSWWLLAFVWSKLYLLRALVAFILVLSAFSIIFAVVLRFGAYKIAPFAALFTTDDPGYLTSIVNFLETIVGMCAHTVLIMDFMLFINLSKETITETLSLMESLTFVITLMVDVTLLIFAMYVALHNAAIRADELKGQAAGMALLVIAFLKIFLGMQKSILHTLKKETVSKTKLATPRLLLSNNGLQNCCTIPGVLKTSFTCLCGVAFVALQNSELQYGAPLLGCVGDDCPRLRVPALVYYSTSGIVFCHFLYGCVNALPWQPNVSNMRIDHMIRLSLTFMLALITVPCGYLCQLNRLAVPYTVWGGVFALSLASLLLIGLDMLRAFPSASFSSSFTPKLDFFMGAKGCNLRNPSSAAVDLIKNIRLKHVSKESLMEQLLGADNNGSQKTSLKTKAADGTAVTEENSSNTDSGSVTSIANTNTTSTGTSNTSTGTSNTSSGTSNTSTGTSNTGIGTSNDTSNGTSNTSTDKTNNNTNNPTSKDVGTTAATSYCKWRRSISDRIVAGKMFYFVLFLRMVTLLAASVFVGINVLKMMHQEALANIEVVTMAYYFYHIITTVSLLVSLTYANEPYVIYDAKVRLIKFSYLLLFEFVILPMDMNFSFLVAAIIPTVLDVTYDLYLVLLRDFSTRKKKSPEPGCLVLHPVHLELVL